MFGLKLGMSWGQAQARLGSKANNGLGPWQGRAISFMAHVRPGPKDFGPNLSLIEMFSLHSRTNETIYAYPVMSVVTRLKGFLLLKSFIRSVGESIGSDACSKAKVSLSKPL